MRGLPQVQRGVGAAGGAEDGGHPRGHGDPHCNGAAAVLPDQEQPRGLRQRGRRGGLPADRGGVPGGCCAARRVYRVPVGAVEGAGAAPGHREGRGAGLCAGVSDAVLRGGGVRGLRVDPVLGGGGERRVDPRALRGVLRRGDPRDAVVPAVARRGRGGVGAVLGGDGLPMGARRGVLHEERGSGSNCSSTTRTWWWTAAAC